MQCIYVLMFPFSFNFILFQKELQFIDVKQAPSIKLQKKKTTRKIRVFVGETLKICFY